jgi:hypothetical protein
LNERSRDRDSEALSHEGSNGGRWPNRRSLRGFDADRISMRVVIVPPRFEGLPTASSQTVPMNGYFSLVLSILMIDQRFRPTRRMLIPLNGGRGPTQKK